MGSWYGGIVGAEDNLLVDKTGAAKLLARQADDVGSVGLEVLRIVEIDRCLVVARELHDEEVLALVLIRTEPVYLLAVDGDGRGLEGQHHRVPSCSF